MRMSSMVLSPGAAGGDLAYFDRIKQVSKPTVNLAGRRAWAVPRMLRSAPPSA
jgi:hypothetical protein